MKEFNELNRESRELDESLASEAQQMIANAVRALPEDEPSLSWRSNLNARISDCARKSARKARFTWIAAPSFGLACVIALAVFVRIGGGTAPVATSIEQQILDAHRDEVLARAVAGRGLVAGETPRTIGELTTPQWQESDLEAL
jgi:hypothetical protein